MKATEQKQFSELIEPIVTVITTILYATVILYYVVGVL